ncbi:Pnap_2097 family protein [Jannaschia marina]|uniref:Pnap_2097 family protein n=1 Tax=Jannaschia marina TaxID=2741674 RepID=UPI0015CE1CC8|nr:Pnap_2097 family protein [Jannaschia marina]
MLDAEIPALSRSSVTRQVLGMQQLAPNGVSEHWLLGTCGDIHWHLVADALGQDSLNFRAADGRPLYAAFRATRLEQARTGPLLGEDLRIHSGIAAAGLSQIGSQHILRRHGRKIGTLLMLSTFVTHDETGSNRRIVRARPARPCRLPEAGPELIALERRARDISRRFRTRRMPLDRAKRIEPSYTLDFNAVGLLYFPSFSRIAESTAATRRPIRRREMIYMGNVDPGEAVHVRRSGAEVLIARTDGRIIAISVEDRLRAA